jgi:hypothetical protein
MDLLLLAQSHSWLDYLIAISTAIAALGTLSAVLITLYLNVWREQRLKPKLTLGEYEDTLFGVGFAPREPNDESVWGIPLLVHNATGRRTAHNAQVLVTFGARKHDADEWVDLVVDQPLAWKFGSRPSRGGGTGTVDIPPGVSRKVFVAFIGEGNQLYKTLWPNEPMHGGFADEGGHMISYDEFGNEIPSSPPIAGVLATVPFTQDDAFWFWRDREYRLRLTLTSHPLAASPTISKFRTTAS